jgi:SAM-dependent methyltransferase
VPDAPRWHPADPERAAEYAERFDRLAAQGADVHGEARFVAALGVHRVLDAGCGTGRVGAELARRGLSAVGVDADPAMLEVARTTHPEMDWRLADLSVLALAERFDAAVLAGNVMLFVAPGTECAVVAHLGAHLRPGGLLVAGFSLRRGGLGLADYDGCCAAAGLELAERFATWERDPFSDGDYAVSVHRRAGADA